MSEAAPTPIEDGAAGLEELSTDETLADGWQEDILVFLDGLSENAAPAQRATLNPIIIGLRARMLAEKLRMAVATGHLVPRAEVEGAYAPVRARTAVEEAVIYRRDWLNASKEASALRSEVERLERERDEARATNRDFHRRLQKAEAFRARHGATTKRLWGWFRDRARNAERRAEAAESRLAQAEAATNEMREAAGLVAGIALWRDEYPDGPDIICHNGDDSHARLKVSPDQVRRARVALSTPPVTTETVSTGGGE